MNVFPVSTNRSKTPFASTATMDEPKVEEATPESLPGKTDLNLTNSMATNSLAESAGFLSRGTEGVEGMELNRSSSTA